MELKEKIRRYKSLQNIVARSNRLKSIEKIGRLISDMALSNDEKDREVHLNAVCWKESIYRFDHLTVSKYLGFRLYPIAPRGRVITLHDSDIQSIRRAFDFFDFWDKLPGTEKRLIEMAGLHWFRNSKKNGG